MSRRPFFACDGFLEREGSNGVQREQLRTEAVLATCKRCRFTGEGVSSSLPSTVFQWLPLCVYEVSATGLRGVPIAFPEDGS